MVTGSLLMPSTHDPSQGAGHRRPVNSGKLLVACSRSMASDQLPCELVLLALGFVGAERHGVVAELGLRLDTRGNVACDGSWATSHEKVFVCGDMTRGQSLIVWAISEGRSCAAAVDRFLMGDTALPAAVMPGQLAIR